MENTEDEIFLRLLLEMKMYDPEKDYYAFTFTANGKGMIQHETISRWVGWADKKFTKEIREPRIICPDQAVKYWQLLGQNYLVVNKEEHFYLFGLVGGNALIEKDILRKMRLDLLEPDICTRSGPDGFISVKNLPGIVFNHAPTPKQRMRILKRDKYRCKICGRRPADYVDIELHVHHIRPSSKGGLTEDENLITLCQTCHQGLDPHADHSLFELIDQKDTAEKLTSDFLASVKRYRQLIQNAIS
jgi:hypothetical protein